MALETVIFEQDPFIYSHKDYINCDIETYAGLFGQLEEETKPEIVAHDQDQQRSRVADIIIAGGDHLHDSPASPATAAAAPPRQKRRRRSKSTKNEEEIENQRMTHIAVERNRRRQMNDYLATLRSMMPPSYAQRGDQASIVGGAINYVKELEQHVHFLQAHKSNHDPHKEPHQANEDREFSNGFPLYHPSNSPVTDAVDLAGERRSKVADVEATMAESHASIKVVEKRSRPKQLVKMVAGFQSIGLTVLHLNVTTVADQSVLYSFSVKVEEGCQLTNANDIASAVHDMIEMIRRELSSASI